MKVTTKFYAFLVVFSLRKKSNLSSNYHNYLLNHRDSHSGTRASAGTTTIIKPGGQRIRGGFTIERGSPAAGVAHTTNPKIVPRYRSEEGKKVEQRSTLSPIEAYGGKKQGNGGNVGDGCSISDGVVVRMVVKMVIRIV